MDEDTDEVQQIIIDEGEEFSLSMECETCYEEPENEEKPNNRLMVKKKMKQVSNKLVEVPVRRTTSDKALFDGKFFTVVAEFYTENKCRRKIRKIKAKCMLCVTKQTYLTCSYDSTSNFLRHIRLKHGRSAYDSYMAYKKCKVLGKTLDQATTFNVMPTPDTSPMPRILEPPSQDKVQRLVGRFQVKLLKFMINCMQPLSLVDDSNFRDLFPEVLTPMLSSTAVGAKIAESFSTCREKLIDALQDVKYICITIDIWTDKSNSFVGFTSHWMDEEFVKKSAVLACSRIVDLTSENVLNYMDEVLKTYNLNNEQVVGVVTNNGRCYAKALRKLEIRDYALRNSGDCYLTTDANLSFDEKPEMIRDGDGDFEFHELEVDAQLHSSLKNMKNVCHMLNTIAVDDFRVLLDDYEVIAAIHEGTMKKCDILWNSCLDLSVKERVSQIIERELPLPLVTSWVSVHHSLKTLFEVRHELPQVCQELKTEEFLPEEIEYLEIYTNIMKPISAAIETLEGNNVYFGYVLPTLLTIKMKLEEIKESENPVSPLMAEFILDRFKDKFQLYLTLDTSEIYVRHAILAAVSHPKLKLRWISNNEKTAEVKHLLIDECVKLNVETDNMIEEVEDDDFFAACLQSNDGSSVRNEVKSSAEVEVLRFLASKDKNIEMLHSFPSIKIMFLKYNTLLTSPSPVNKLFSFESLMYRESTPSSEELQAYLFLKGNNHLLCDL